MTVQNAWQSVRRTWALNQGAELRCPVFLSVAIAASVASVWNWTGHSILPFVAGPGAETHGAWRYLSSLLPHANGIHLVFNLCWWWVFGVAAERAWGSVRFLGACVLLALFSGLAESAVGSAGIGLSGVLFGLCALLAIAGRTDERLAEVATRRTLVLFGVWFVACIALTVSGIMPVGNAAHAGGAIGGLLLGAWTVAWRLPRSAWAALTCLALALVWSGARFGPVARNFPLAARSVPVTLEAYRLLDSGRHREVVELIEAQGPVTDLYLAQYYALALQALERKPEALAAYRRAVELNTRYYTDAQPQMVRLCSEMTEAELTAGNLHSALHHAEEGVKVAEGASKVYKAHAWFQLGRVRQRLQEHHGAVLAYRKSVELDATLQASVAPAIASMLGYAVSEAVDRLGETDNAASLLPQLEEAFAAYKDAVAADPSFRVEASPQIIWLSTELARSAIDADKPRRAIEAVGEGLMFSEGVDPEYVGHCWYFSGLAHQDLEEWSKAIESYREAARLDPTLRDTVAPAIASLLASEAYDLIEDGEVARAHAILREALEWDPKNEYANDILDAEAAGGGT